MLFHIDESIAAKIEQGVQDDSLVTFAETLAESRRRGRHIVFGTPHAMETISSLRHLSKRSAATFSALSRKVALKKQFASRVCTFVRAVAAPDVMTVDLIDNRRIISISSNLLVDDELFRDIALVAENLTDIDFIKHFSKNFMRLTVEYRNVALKSDDVSGGGSTTPQVYEAIKHRRNRFCLCIVDSDIEYSGGPLGSNVAGPIVATEKSNPSDLTFAHIIPTYSMENLIPPGLIKLANQANIEDIPDEALCSKLMVLSGKPYWVHLPLKKGIRCTRLRPQDLFANYWGNRTSEAIPSSPNQCAHWGNWRQCGRSGCAVLDAIPSKTLSAMVTYLDSVDDNTLQEKITRQFHETPEHVKQILEN